jgi:hypothetical protein
MLYNYSQLKDKFFTNFVLAKFTNIKMLFSIKLKNMKLVLVSLFIVATSFSFSQLIDGTLIDESRKMISVSTFKLIDNNEGVAFYQLAVNRKGEVTSATLLSAGTTIISTPTRMKMRNYLMTLKFEEGMYYPEFHQVRVKITTSKL